MKLRLAVLCLALIAPSVALAQDPIAAEFSRAVTAIVVEGDEISFVLVDQTPSARRARVLTEGDAFKDGWTVKEATPQSAVLRRGPVSVVVDLTRFKPAAPPESPPPDRGPDRA